MSVPVTSLLTDRANFTNPCLQRLAQPDILTMLNPKLVQYSAQEEIGQSTEGNRVKQEHQEMRNPGPQRTDCRKAKVKSTEKCLVVFYSVKSFTSSLFFLQFPLRWRTHLNQWRDESMKHHEIKISPTFKKKTWTWKNEKRTGENE